MNGTWPNRLRINIEPLFGFFLRTFDWPPNKLAILQSENRFIHLAASATKAVEFAGHAFCQQRFHRGAVDIATVIVLPQEKIARLLAGTLGAFRTAIKPS